MRKLGLPVAFGSKKKKYWVIYMLIYSLSILKIYLILWVTFAAKKMIQRKKVRELQKGKVTPIPQT